MEHKIFKSGHLKQIFTPSLANNSRGHSLKLHLSGFWRREQHVTPFPFSVVPLCNSLNPSLPSKLRLPTPSRLELTETGRGLSKG